MKKSKKILIAIMVSCTILAMGTVALATRTDFIITMPAFGHKTCATGVKSTEDNGWDAAVHPETEFSTNIVVWCDANNDDCTTNKTIKRSGNWNFTYRDLPGVNSAMALRTQPNGMAGKKFDGGVNFK